MPGLTRIILTFQTEPSLYGFSCAYTVTEASASTHSSAAPEQRRIIFVHVMILLPCLNDSSHLPATAVSPTSPWIAGVAILCQKTASFASGGSLTRMRLNCRKPHRRQPCA